MKVPSARELIIYPGIQIALSAAIHLLAKLSWGWAVFLCFVAWPLVRHPSRTLDDDLPGGLEQSPMEQELQTGKLANGGPGSSRG